MEDDAVDYVRQILEALRFMHERNVVHLDLKVGGRDFLSHEQLWIPFRWRWTYSRLFPAISRILGSIHTYLDISGNGDFFCPFQPSVQTKTPFTGTENAGFQIRRPEWRLLKTPASRLREPDGLKGGFLNSMRSYKHTTSMRMLCKGCYRISIVLAFSYGRAKTVQIRHVWTHFFENGIKKSPFFKQYLDTRGHPSPDGLALETCFYGQRT